MQIGYNNDIEYRGMTFHIQTEDRGGADQCVESQVFFRGQVLDTKIISYADKLASYGAELRQQKIQALMRASHKGLYNKLIAGEYDEYIGLEPLNAANERINVDASADDFTPGRLHQEFSEVEPWGPQEEGQPVSLSELSAHFFQVDEDSDAMEFGLDNESSDLTLDSEFSDALLLDEEMPVAEGLENQFQSHALPTNVLKTSDLEALVAVIDDEDDESTQVIGGADMHDLLMQVQQTTGNEENTGVLDANSVTSLMADMSRDDDVELPTDVMNAGDVNALITMISGRNDAEHAGEKGGEETESNGAGNDELAHKASPMSVSPVRRKSWQGCPDIQEKSSLAALVENYLQRDNASD